MFHIALFIGLYAYLIFFLGIWGLLYSEIIFLITGAFVAGIFVSQRKNIKKLRRRVIVKRIRFDKRIMFLLLILFSQIVVNLFGSLGPELAFDALWYHLTLPKIWILEHRIAFIPGGLLYYSAMPKLGELLFVPALLLAGEIGAKVLHFSFGLLICLALYQISRKFFTQVLSLLAVVIFYANLVVAWESITAYIDLIRTFFECMALWSFLLWQESEKRKWFVLSAVMLGFAITTKLLAIGSLLVFIMLILLFIKGLHEKFLNVISYLFIAMFIPLPWFLFSFIYTGNPVYPFFNSLYPIAYEPLQITHFFREVWIVFTQSADPISPLYLIFLPIILWLSVVHRAVFFGKEKGIRIIFIFSLLALFIWYLTPRTGGGRFLLPYLPAFSFLCIATIGYFLKNAQKIGEFLPRLLIGIILLVALSSVIYRLGANMKYMPVILGQESKEEFLTRNLNFTFGDFYDVDGYFSKQIKQHDQVLLIGFHNLYYVNFPFVDSSWQNPEDEFTYIATQNMELPKEYDSWQLIYENNKTMVKLYSK